MDVGVIEDDHCCVCVCVCVCVCLVLRSVWCMWASSVIFTAAVSSSPVGGVVCHCGSIWSP